MLLVDWCVLRIFTQKRQPDEGFRRRPHDPAQPELNRGGEHGIGRHDVVAKRLAVRRDPGSRYCCQVHDGIGARHGLDGLAEIGEVDDQAWLVGVRRSRQVHIRDGVAGRTQLGHHRPARLAAPARDDDPLDRARLPHGVSLPRGCFASTTRGCAWFVVDAAP